MKHLTKLTIAVVFAPLTVSCASDSGSGSGPDWSQATPYRVTTGHGDRVTVKVVGNAEAGYDYSARILHTTRSDPDPLDRQRVLADAVQTVVTKLCAKGANASRAVHSADNYEESGRFVCTTK